MSLYKGSTAIAGIPTGLIDTVNNKANTDLDNLSDTGKTVIDGQWVWNYLKAETSTAIGNYTIDLSTYLPNDNYNYEVWARMYVSRGSDTSGTNTQVKAFDSHDNGAFSFFIAQIQADGANFQQADGTILFTVDTTRKIYKSVSSYVPSAADLYLYKYRRIGTNE